MASRRSVSRIASGSLGLPRGSQLVADFTDGSVPSAAVTFPSPSGNAATGIATAYNPSNGLGAYLSFQAGIAGKYVTMRYEPNLASPGSTIDLSASDWFAFECEWPEGTGATYSQINIYIATQTGSTFTNYKNRGYGSGAGKTPYRQTLVCRQLETVSPAWTLISGGPNLAAAGKIEFRLLVHASLPDVPAELYIRKIWTGRNRPIVIFTFDDAMDGQINYAYPSLAAYGWKGTLYASPTHINKAGRLTSANLRTLYDAGWDMGVQQYNDSADIPVNFAGTTGLTQSAGVATFVNAGQQPHFLSVGQLTTISGAASPAYNGTVTVLSTPNAYTFTYAISGSPLSPDPGIPWCPRLSEELIRNSFDRVRDYYADLGMVRGNDFVAYSNGVTTKAVEALLVQWGYVMGRTTRVNVDPMIGFDPRSRDVVTMMHRPGITMDQQTSTTILGYLDKCIDRGMSMPLYCHDIDPTPAALTVTQSEWNLIIAGVRARELAGLCDVLSDNDFYNAVMA